MKNEKVCQYCGAVLEKDEACGCPGSQEAQRMAAADERVRQNIDSSEVEIRLSKKPGSDIYRMEIEANDTASLLCGLAMLIRKTASMMGDKTDRVFAVLATVLFTKELGKDA